jgi:hypothetical protein
MRAPSVNGLSGEGRGASGDWPVGPARKWRNAGERLEGRAWRIHSWAEMRLAGPGKVFILFLFIFLFSFFISKFGLNLNFKFEHCIDFYPPIIL